MMKEAKIRELIINKDSLKSFIKRNGYSETRIRRNYWKSCLECILKEK